MGTGDGRDLTDVEIKELKKQMASISGRIGGAARKKWVKENDPLFYKREGYRGACKRWGKEYTEEGFKDWMESKNS